MLRTMDVTPESFTGKSILSRTLDTAGTVLCLSRYQLSWKCTHPAHLQGLTLLLGRICKKILAAQQSTHAFCIVYGKLP